MILRKYNQCVIFNNIVINKKNSYHSSYSPITILVMSSKQKEIGKTAYGHKNSPYFTGLLLYLYTLVLFL